MKKVALISLGCPKNLVDSETMLAALADHGLCPVAEPEEADLLLINTCGFIESAKREGIEQILAAAELKRQGKIQRILVTGCLSQRYREEIAEEFPEVDGFLGTTSEARVAEAADEVLAGRKFAAFDGETDSPLFGPRILSTPSYTAYLKIAEGCNNRCTYCAIPLIRGPLRSQPIDDLLDQARALSEAGVQELILIAQDTTAYGNDRGERALVPLLERLCELPFHWIRLLYCYPERIGDDLIACMKAHPQILPYFDIPMQHCDGAILRAMRRPGNEASLRELIEKLRRELPEAVLRTTLIVGFPGETDEQFERLCEFVKEMRFDKLGAFAYSPEEGTEAAEMLGQIDEEVKQARLDALMALQSRLSEEILTERVGQVSEVLCEGFDEESDCYVGRTAGDAPDVDGKVFFRSREEVLPGQFVRVEIKSALTYDLVGEALE